MYESLLFGHLLGVAVMLSGLGVHMVSVERLRQVRTVTELRMLLGAARYGERMALGGSFLLVGAGITLAARFWSFADAWIATSIGLVIAQGLAGSVIVDRRMKRLRAALQSAPDGPLSTEVTALARDPLLHAGSRIAVPIIVEILFLMTVKPFVPGILWSLLAAAGLGTLVIWPAFARRSRPRALTGEEASENAGPIEGGSIKGR
jgi:hypothetical protein